MNSEQAMTMMDLVRFGVALVGVAVAVIVVGLVLGLMGAWFKRDHGTLRFWLDSWSGVGRVAIGMARRGYDLQLTRYDARDWRATFFPGRHRPLHRGRNGVGADAVAGGAAGGVVGTGWK